MLRGEELNDGGRGRFLDLVMKDASGENCDVGDGTVVLEVLGEVHHLYVKKSVRCDIQILFGNVTHLNTSKFDVRF